MNRLPIILVVVAGLYACQPNRSTPIQSPLYLGSDSLEVSFSRCGSSATTLVLLHGWCINKEYWSEQITALCPDYRVIAVDLPGFGQSGVTARDWTINQYARDVATIIDQLALEQVILVGHSMSGDIALETALMKPGVVKAIVGIDNFKDAAFELNDEARVEIDGFINLLSSDFPQIAPAFAQENLFSPTTDSTIIKRVSNDFATARPEVAVPVLRSLFNYREAQALSRYGGKLVLINSNSTPTDEGALKGTGVDYKLYEIDGTGHYPMNEKPREFNLLLTRALQEL